MQKTQQGLFGKRLKIWLGGRSGGKQILHTRVWVRWEWHRGNVYPHVGSFNLMVGNPRVHYRWAFNAYFFYKGV